MSVTTSESHSGLESTSMIIREREPKNLEFPFASLDEVVTPIEQFYVRCHFAVPKLEEKNWRLKVEGLVERKLDLGLDEIRRMPAVKRLATLECAGNGRIFLVPQVQGAQWQLGAVSTAEWTGVPLSEILERAGVEPNAVEVVLEGADHGKAKEQPAPPGEIQYARSVPLPKAMDGVLLAYEMNGKPLPAAHGFPLRAIVPGWFGMASVKWLSRIILVDRPFQGYFQTTDYGYWQSVTGLPVRIPITEMQVKAQIARPAPYEVVRRGVDYRVFGAAWSGESPVTRVDVSTDGGQTFAGAKLLGETAPHCWRMWEYEWQVPSEAGPQILMARATDARGNVQPENRDANWGTYVVCHMLPVEVEVK